MVRRKNIDQRRKILEESFRLFRIYGVNNVSTKMIADKVQISKSLLQSYYPYKSSITNKIGECFLNVINKNFAEVKTREYPLGSFTCAFIWLLFDLGFNNNGLSMIITEVFVGNEFSDNWIKMLNKWIEKENWFDKVKVLKKDIFSGIYFVAAGVGKLFGKSKDLKVSAEDLYTYVAESFLIIFLHMSRADTKLAMDNGIKIAEMINTNEVLYEIETMFATADLG